MPDGTTDNTPETFADTPEIPIGRHIVPVKVTATTHLAIAIDAKTFPEAVLKVHERLEAGLLHGWEIEDAEHPWKIIGKGEVDLAPPADWSAQTP